MIRVYRMWRFVRMVEKKFLSIEGMSAKEFKKHQKTLTDGYCIGEFSNKKSILCRRYGFNNAMRALLMAERFQYIELKEKRDYNEILIVGEAFTFSTWFGLAGKITSSLISINSLLAVIISAIALIVSLTSKNS